MAQVEATLPWSMHCKHCFQSSSTQSQLVELMTPNVLGHWTRLLTIQIPPTLQEALRRQNKLWQARQRQMLPRKRKWSWSGCKASRWTWTSRSFGSPITSRTLNTTSTFVYTSALENNRLRVDGKCYILVYYVCRSVFQKSLALFFGYTC